jgi:hypothetical protein
VHHTSLDSPHVSEFWKRHHKLALGSPYGYYGGDRAAAANADGGGADGIYLFNYPCLFELTHQQPSPADSVPATLIDLRSVRQGDFSRCPATLEELGSADRLRGKDKRFLFYFNEHSGYRHHDQDRATLDRGRRDGKLVAIFRCFEEYERAKSMTLRWKVENVCATSDSR